MSAPRSLIRPSWLTRQAWAVGHAPRRPVGAEAFLNTLAAEARRIDRCVRATIRRATARHRIPFPAFRFREDLLGVGAWCRPDPDSGAIAIEMSAGTILAIDDLALFATTMASFLIPSRAAMDLAPKGGRFRLETPISSAGHYLGHEGCFFDYGKAFIGDGLDPARLVFAQPSAHWRIAQAAMLAELIIAWVLFHEYSHWALAHPDLLDAESYALGFADHPDATARRFAFERGRQPGLARDLPVSRMLEIHADTAAFHLLIDLARAPAGPVARFNRIMADAPPREPLAMALADHRQTTRLCLTAAGIACIILDGKPGDRRATDSTHPSPSARFMNLQSQGPLTVPGMLARVDGEFIIVNDAVEGFTAHDLAEMIALSTTDVQLVASIAARARDRSGHPEGQDPRTWHHKAWRADMRRQWRTGAESPRHETATGRELEKIPLDNEQLNEILRRVQLRRFGSLFDIHMDGLINPGDI